MPIAWATSSCVQHDARCLGCRRSMEMTAAFPTICLSDLFSFTAVLSTMMPLPPSNSLSGIYVGSMIFLYTSPVHNPFILCLSPSLGFHIYFLSLLLPSFNFPSFMCVLDDAQSFCLVHFTCFSFLGFRRIFLSALYHFEFCSYPLESVVYCFRLFSIYMELVFSSS